MVRVARTDLSLSTSQPGYVQVYILGAGASVGQNARGGPRWPGWLPDWTTGLGFQIGARVGFWAGCVLRSKSVVDELGVPHGWGGQQQRVNAVEYTAMTGQQSAGVLYPCRTF